MPRYIAKTKVWLGHENRFVGNTEGNEVEFESTFPEGFKPGGNIVEVKPKRAKKSVKPDEGSSGDEITGDADLSGDTTDDDDITE